MFSLTMDERLAQSTARPRFYALATGMFGGCALLLSIVEVYGVISIPLRNGSRDCSLPKWLEQLVSGATALAGAACFTTLAPIAGVAALSVWIATSRISKIDPSVALRVE